jgi:hypothetical protein
MRTLRIALLTTLLTLAAMAEPTHNRPNSLGVSEVYSNPYSYLLALPIEGTAVDGGVSIRFWPFGTPQLYDETVYFCKVGDEFDGKRGVLIIVYETRAHRLHQGIACHNLISVFEVNGQ